MGQTVLFGIVASSALVIVAFVGVRFEIPKYTPNQCPDHQGLEATKLKNSELPVASA